ncbi:Asp-tRNA(Asn)/Glu-tRNA(Gln) amidotransferase subunit GatB [Streptomyces violaceorubidus]
MLAGEGTPGRGRGQAQQRPGASDEGALAVDEAIAGNPGVADKIRGAKVAAAGALVGAVMKATRGRRRRPRVKELILEKLGVSELTPPTPEHP